MRLVHKYGGSSVATPEKIMAIARRLAQLKKEGKDLVVVCSAMGKTTNGLIALARQVNPSPPNGKWTPCCPPEKSRR